VWDVLKALRSHDEVLAEHLDQYRTNMAKRSGTTSQTVDDRIIFDLPTTVGLNFSTALRTVLVEASTASWEFWFGLLEEYVTQKGDARVPSKFETDDNNKLKLGVWCDTQRVNFKKGILSRRRVAKIADFEQYGWQWSLKDSQREYNIQRIKEFYDREGHSFIKERHQEPDGFYLGAKLKGLINAYESGTLEKEWISYLEKELYIKWDSSMFWWLAQYVALRRWAKVNYSSSPPRDTIANIRVGQNNFETRNISLFRNKLITSYKYWETDESKENYRRKNPPIQLSKKQINAVLKIPFWNWDALDERWMIKYSALLQFIEREEDSNVPANKHIEILPDGSKHELSRLMRKQRDRYAEGTLETDRIEKLNALNMDWTGALAPKKRKFKLDDGDFAKRFEILESFVKKYGHAVVKQDCIFEGHKLGSYVSRWRQAYIGVASNRADLSEEIVAKLEAVHPTWLWSAADTREGIAQPFKVVLVFRPVCSLVKMDQGFISGC
jgi:hypothetical protein